MKFLLVFLVLELTAVAVVNCIQCYSCINCNDPFENSNSISEMSCSSGQCMKTKAKSGNEHVVVRSCSPTKIDNGCTEQEVLGTDTEVCFCDTELCNGSPTFGTSLRFLLLLAAVAVIVIHLTL